MDVDALLTGNLTQNLKSMAMTSRGWETYVPMLYKVQYRLAAVLGPFFSSPVGGGLRSFTHNTILIWGQLEWQ
jgi:hypothetical protein